MITATFTYGLDEVTTLGFTQRDYGQRLEIHGLTFPATFQVHFTCKRAAEAVVRLGVNHEGVGTTAIPDGLLEQDTPITAWIYEVGEDSGETIKVIRLPVTPRQKPQDFISAVTPAEQTMLEEFLADVNTAMTDAVNTLTAHVADKENPHETTYVQVGASPDNHAHDLRKILKVVLQEINNERGTDYPRTRMCISILRARS